MRRFHIALSLICILSSCKNRQERVVKTIDFEIFQITVPADWERISFKGIDSYVGGIETTSGDTIFFDYGINTYKMNNVVKVYDEEEYRTLDSLGFDIDDFHFSKYASIDENQGVFHKEYYLYKSIGSHKAKISIPKNVGNGVSAVYFNNVNDKNSLYIYGKNLDRLTQNDFLNAVNSINLIKE